MSQHQLKTPADCDCREGLLPFACPICDGGLAWCKVCNGAEGSLPLDCPGEPMTPEQEQAVMEGSLQYFAGAWWKADAARSVFFCQ